MSGLFFPSRQSMQGVPSARGQRGTHKGGLRPLLSLPPLKIPLLKLPAVRSGKSVWLFRLGMCRAEYSCKLSVYMKTGAAYVPPFPFTKAEVHTLLRQPSVLSAQRKGGGISKGGNLGSPLWLRAKGTPAQTIDLRQHRWATAFRLSTTSLCGITLIVTM